MSFFLTQPAQADDVYTFVIKKQEIKEKSRWSLSEWLDTRDRMRIQDLWLAVHSPSPYEYYIGANYKFNQAISSGPFQAQEVYIGAFSSILGLEVRYEYGLNSRLFGLVNFRIFGRHDQATNITLQTGIVHTITTLDSFRNFAGGASLTFYVTRYFGIQALYRHYFPSSNNVTGINFGGSLAEGGGFIDFKFVRLHLDYISDTSTVLALNGIMLGTKIYF